MWRSALPVPGDTQVSVLHDRVEVRNTDLEALHVGGALLQQSLTASDHLCRADAGLLRQAPQRQSLQTQLHHSLLLHLQSAHKQESDKVDIQNKQES